MTKEVVLLRAVHSNNPGELVSFEAARCDKLVEDGLARWPTEEEIQKILDAHESHKEEVANEAKNSGSVSARKVVLPSARSAFEKVEKGTKPAPKSKE